jgi:hypothetical protein
MVVLSACTAILFTAFAAAISAALLFPVPFFVLTLAPVFHVALIISCRIVLSEHILQRMLQNRDQLSQFISIVAAQNFMAFVYPAYETLFRVAKGTSFQVPVILLLPIIKVALKNVVLRCMIRLEDMMPEAVIFTVDFFNAVYVATCMQSTSSTTDVTAITVTDLTQTAFMLFGLHQRTAKLLPKLRLIAGSASEHDSLVDLLCAICRDPEEFGKQSRFQISIRSCLLLALSVEDTELLNRLDEVPSRAYSHVEVHPDLFQVASSPSVHNIVPSAGKPKRKIRSIFTRVQKGVHPVNSATQPWVVEWRSPASQMSIYRSMALREALEALFTTECIVVTAYLDAVVPLFYCCYISVMVYMPNSQYHRELTDLTPENVGATVFPVFVFGMLQVATFLVLAVVIKRNCGMQMLYQLAFVLEMQMPLIQAKLVFWVLITLCFRIAHFGTEALECLFPYLLQTDINRVILPTGVDFTFQFNEQDYRSWHAKRSEPPKENKKCSLSAERHSSFGNSIQIRRFIFIRRPKPPQSSFHQSSST